MASAGTCTLMLFPPELPLNQGLSTFSPRFHVIHHFSAAPHPPPSYCICPRLFLSHQLLLMCRSSQLCLRSEVICCREGRWVWRWPSSLPASTHLLFLFLLQVSVVRLRLHTDAHTRVHACTYIHPLLAVSPLRSGTKRGTQRN